MYCIQLSNHFMGLLLNSQTMLDKETKMSLNANASLCPQGGHVFKCFVYYND